MPPVVVGAAEERLENGSADEALNVLAVEHVGERVGRAFEPEIVRLLYVVSDLRDRSVVGGDDDFRIFRFGDRAEIGDRFVLLSLGGVFEPDRVLFRVAFFDGFWEFFGLPPARISRWK